MSRAAVIDICREFDIRIVPKHIYPAPGETRATATMERILRKRGEGHLRLVLSAMAETKGNNGLMDEITLWAVSDLFIACEDVIDDNASAAFDMLDQLPLGPYLAIVQELRGIVSQRAALGGMLYLHLRRLRADTMTGRQADTKKLKRVGASEAEKGRSIVGGPGRMLTSQKVEVGRSLLRKKLELPKGTFQRWVAEESGYTYKMALQCMKLAREADQARAA